MARKETFFIIDVPVGMTARQWGRRYSDKLGFDYDSESRTKTKLLAWPYEISAARLTLNLAANGIRFVTYRGDPEKLLGVSG